MSILDVIFFTGMGALLVLGFQYAGKFSKVYKFDWRAWTAGSLSILLFWLSITWAYASFAEHEIQAAWVGLFIFAGLGVVLALLTRRLAQQKE